MGKADVLKQRLFCQQIICECNQFVVRSIQLVQPSQAAESVRAQLSQVVVAANQMFFREHYKNFVQTCSIPDVKVVQLSASSQRFSAEGSQSVLTHVKSEIEELKLMVVAKGRQLLLFFWDAWIWTNASTKS